jgi:hypothetical protein
MPRTGFHRMHHRSLKAGSVAALMAIVVGCGGAARLETVSGKVTLDGSPLPAATLLLVPVNLPTDADAKAKGPFIAKTDDQGEFTFGATDNPGGGVPAGAYRLVMTTTQVEGANEDTVLPPEKVPAPYPAGVDYEVPAGGTDAANFDLKSK